MTALSLRPYQIEKISEARALMSQGKKSICLVSPTGSGKTVIIAHIIHSAIAKGKRVLFLAHRRELIDQCAAKLRDLGIWDYNVVLSGHPHSRNPDAPVHIASIQTLIRREYPPADLVAIDECLTGDSLISTPTGNLSIKDIIAGSRVMTYNNGMVAESNVTAAWSSGEKEIIKIITQSGVEIKCTSNHLIYTGLGWIPAGEITTESKVLLLAGVGAERLCKKTNGEDSSDLLLDTKQKEELSKIGRENIRRSWIRCLSVCADAVKKQDSVIATLWKDLLKVKVIGAFISAYTGTIKGRNSGKWNLLKMNVRQYLEPFLGIPVSCIQTTGALTQGLYLTTETRKQHGLNIKETTLSGLEENYQGESIWVTENSLSLIPLSAYRVWRMFITSALRTAKKLLRLTGLIKSERSVWRGGFATMGQAVGARYSCIPKGIPSKKTKLCAIGFQKIMGKQRSIEAQGAITGFVCQQKPKEKSSLSSLPISLNSCSTRWQQVAHVQRLPQKEVVYDITVAGTHCFFANGILVHNCHHAASGSYQTLLKNYPDAYVLGLTATPERLDGKGLDSLFHDLLNVATVPELVDSGYLVAPQCMGPSQESVAQLKAALARVKQRAGDYADDQLAEAMDSPSLVGDIVSHWQEWGVGQKTIVFAAGIDHSKHIIQQFQSAGIAAAHLDGTMSLPEREGILKAWRGAEINVVSNCQILTEGFDFPELSCCILARPTKSVALYLQMVGRVLRTSPGKSGAIILDHAGNVVEHGPPHIERVWTLGGFAKKRKIETTHACFLPGCGALFVEKDAGAVWWVSATQAAIVENYQFMARKFERMDRSGAEFSQEAKLLICPACGHAACKMCGSHFHPPSADSHDRLVCPQCRAEYSSDRMPVGEQQKRGLVEALDGSLVLIGADSPAIAKLKVKNEYNRLLELARQKNHKRGWVWYKLKEQFSEEQLREALPWHQSSWWKQGAAEHGRAKQ